MTSALYYHGMFAVTLFSCIAMCSPIHNGKLINSPGKAATLILAIAAAILMGTLPIPWFSGADRELYAHSFINYATGRTSELGKDFIFNLYVKLCSGIMNYSWWFLLTALIYCLNYYKSACKIAPQNSFILMLMFCTAFMFYNYGTNTIRAGFAVSFILLALAYYETTVKFYLFLLIGVGCHFSMLIPAAAMIASRYWDRTRIYLCIWTLSIILSALMGHYFEELFSSIAMDDRTSYLNVASDKTTYNVGFRIDFILYSCVPVLTGYLYIVRKNFKDRLYSILFNTYILANSFWILVIRANFSDRFAYLSWFLYPLVLVYPLLKKHIVKNQRNLIIIIVLLHALFTYYMFIR